MIHRHATPPLSIIQPNHLEFLSAATFLELRITFRSISTGHCYRVLNKYQQPFHSNCLEFSITISYLYAATVLEFRITMSTFSQQLFLWFGITISYLSAAATLESRIPFSNLSLATTPKFTKHFYNLSTLTVLKLNPFTTPSMASTYLSVSLPQGWVQGIKRMYPILLMHD